MAQKYTPSARTAGTSSTKPAENLQPVQFIFEKSNYILLAASAVVVALGFVLMSGTTDIYSNTKIVVAPLVVLAGFGLGFYAILKKPAPKA
jgi:ABC-type Fe3+ transport system permease subunit